MKPVNGQAIRPGDLVRMTARTRHFTHLLLVATAPRDDGTYDEGPSLRMSPEEIGIVVATKDRAVCVLTPTVMGWQHETAFEVCYSAAEVQGTGVVP